MPLVWGAAASHMPVAYWLTKPRPPEAADSPLPGLHDEFGRMLDASYRALRDGMSGARLDALVVLVADRGRFFNAADCPEIHVYAGAEIWGDTSLAEAGEARRIRRAPCDARTGAFLIEELRAAGFDVAEPGGEFAPRGDPERGVVASLLDPLERLGFAGPVIPVHVNCHAAPALRGARAAEFGAALGAAIQKSAKRVGILASGGMSGDPNGYLTGWLEPALDLWVLRLFEMRRSYELASVFDLDASELRGSSEELRLWLVAARAMESQGGVGRLVSYQAFHPAVAGVGFFAWGIRSW